jgi:hypothetical protein
MRHIAGAVDEPTRQTRIPDHMRPVITPSVRARGRWAITFASAGSTPSARAGAPSVTKLIQRIWVANKGSATPLPCSGVKAMASASRTPKNIVITSPMLDESR